ncbi:hypothetical protein C8Q80DRAFT_1269030 [Daedaleopsis nitida]|nr:hypothetical protein C8Q80DRAFT_1269030 [Daedaleopsis nitida]
MTQVYDTAQAAFESNPKWEAVAVLLLIGPYFSQFVWHRNQLPQDLRVSKPDVELPRPSISPSALRYLPGAPVTPRQGRSRPYADAILWPAFVRRGENGGVVLSDSFHNTLAYAWAQFDGQLEHQESWFKPQVDTIPNNQLDENLRVVESWLRDNEEVALNEVLNALDSSRRASATAALGEGTPGSGSTTTRSSSGGVDSDSDPSYVPSPNDDQTPSDRVKLPRFYYPQDSVLGELVRRRAAQFDEDPPRKYLANIYPYEARA